MDYSPWFRFLGSKKSFEIMVPLERESQEEQNGASFSFVAPSTDELRVFEQYFIHYCDDLYHVHTFEKQ